VIKTGRAGASSRTWAWLALGALLGWPALAWAPPICSADVRETEDLVLRVTSGTIDGVAVTLTDREYHVSSRCGEGIVNAFLADPDATDGARMSGYKRRP